MARPKKPRTFQVKNTLMKGDDIKSWQRLVRQLFAGMKIDAPIEVDGVYGPQTRAFSHDLLKSLGILATKEMEEGLTQYTRGRVRGNDLTQVEIKRGRAKEAREFRQKLRDRWKRKPVHTPVDKILTDSWGWHPGVHDGVDVITGPDPVIFAMVKSKVIDVRASGWWGLGAPSNPAVKAKGDGIIQLEVLESVGPFKKGMHIGYGHAEKALVKVGDVVRAGAPIGHAGLANAWHIHLMVNDGSVGTRGVGTQDPRPLLDYAVKNG